jgi:hypothetical protein
VIREILFAAFFIQLALFALKRALMHMLWLSWGGLMFVRRA